VGSGISLCDEASQHYSLMMHEYWSVTQN